MGIGVGLDGYGKTQPNGIRSPDFPAHSESLFRTLNRQNLILNNRKSGKSVANKDAREGIFGIHSSKNRVEVNEKKMI
jgi:hypothetical protein